MGRGKVLKKIYQPKILYPLEVSLENKNKIKTSSHMQKLKESITSRIILENVKGSLLGKKNNMDIQIDTEE